MGLTQKDVDNIHKLEDYLKGSPRTLAEMARHLGVTKLKAIDYLEIFTRNPKRYHIINADMDGTEKKWGLE